MIDRGIKAPFLPYDRIAREAEAFLARYHPSRTIPVPVEDIIEKQFNIDIYPVPGLTRAFTANDDGVVAYVNSSLNLITVDYDAWEGHTTRYRFSITHELAHIILHGNIFSQLKANSIAEWKLAMQSIPTDQYRWLERTPTTSPDSFWSPPPNFANSLRITPQRPWQRACVLTMSLCGPTLANISPRYLVPLAKSVRIRIEKEGLWPN